MSWLDRAIREEDPEPDADVEEDLPFRGLVLVSLGLAIAAVVPVAVGAFVLAGGRVHCSWGLLLLPLALCSSAGLGFRLFELLLLWAPRWASLPASTAAGLALFAGWQAVDPVLAPRAVFGQASPLWLLLLLPGYGVLLWLASMVLPRRDAVAPDAGGREAPLDDAAWARRALGRLRLDRGMGERRARAAVRDARAMAAAAGRPAAGVAACALRWAGTSRVEWWLVLGTLVALAAAGSAWSSLRALLRRRRAHPGPGHGATGAVG